MGRKRYTVEQIIHLNGPCKMDVMRDGHVISKAEVTLEEVYALVVKNSEGAEENGAWFEC